MKTTGVVWLLVTLLTAPVLRAEQTATARLQCWSLRFYRGTAHDYAGFIWRLDLTTLSSGWNYELARDFFNSGYTHSSYVDLYSQLYGETQPGGIVLDVPDAGDANGSGFNDFFEVSQAVDGLVSSGGLQSSGFFINTGLQATWRRDAGSTTGSCILTLADPTNPFVDMSFTHTFDLIEYNGVLLYTPATSTVIGQLVVTNAYTDDVLSGTMVAEKSESDPQNELVMVDLSLTNSASQPLVLYAESTLFRDLTYPTNYYGWAGFLDGDPNTAEEDYYDWLISIDDTTDLDQDGIPDFSDDPAAAPPTAPVMGIELGPSDVLITLTGDIGRVHEIESSGSIAATNWVVVRSVTLTNNPQTESIERPAVTTFWRARALP